MSGIVGAIIAAVVGSLVAFGGVSLVVNSQTAIPAPVDKPYIVYGNK